MGANLRTIVAESEVIRQRIAALPTLGRAAIAAAASRRLMARHLKRPSHERSDFVLSWDDAISKLWTALRDPASELDSFLDAQLNSYYSGPYCHELGADALPGADEDAASAAIYAVEAYCRSSMKAACSGTLQVLTEAEARANAITEERGEELMSNAAEERRIELQQIELDWLNIALSLIEREGITRRSLPELESISGSDEGLPE